MTKFHPNWLKASFLSFFLLSMNQEFEKVFKEKQKVFLFQFWNMVIGLSGKHFAHKNFFRVPGEVNLILENFCKTVF